MSDNPEQFDVELGIGALSEEMARALSQQDSIVIGSPFVPALPQEPVRRVETGRPPFVPEFLPGGGD